MHIEPFFVEQWMNAHETTATWNIAETCVHSLTLDELLEMSGDADGVLRRLKETWLGYGDIVGSPRLRAAIAALYGERIGPDEVLTANGAIGANFLALYALVGAGRRRSSASSPPTSSCSRCPASLGADVHAVRLREEDGYLPDPDALRAALRRAHPPHRAEQPEQPDRRAHRRAAAARDRRGRARARRLALLRRGVPQAGARAGHDGAVRRRPVREGREQRQHEQELLARRAAHRLGRRPAELIQRCLDVRDYTTISGGVLDDALAAVALEHRDRVLERSLEIVRGNLARRRRVDRARAAAALRAAARRHHRAHPLRLRPALRGLLPGHVRLQRRLRHAGHRLRRGALVPARATRAPATCSRAGWRPSPPTCARSRAEAARSQAVESAARAQPRPRRGSGLVRGGRRSPTAHAVLTAVFAATAPRPPASAAAWATPGRRERASARSPAGAERAAVARLDATARRRALAAAATPALAPCWLLLRRRGPAVRRA